MDNTNASTNNENLIPKLKNSGSYYLFSGLIIFLIIMMFMIFYDISPNFNKPTKSQQQMIADIFIILFFSLLVVGICIIFLPNAKEIKQLFEQIGNVTYVILYTIFAILFYTLTSKDILNDYSYLINPAMLGLGAFSFYKGTSDNYIEKFNINYERIKMLILLFCLITLIITFYNINPGGAASQYFGYSLLLTIIIAVFGFLYLIIVMTLQTDEGKIQKNLLNNFSSFGAYGSILFILFLIIITTIISINKDTFFANKEKSASVIIILLAICILWSVMLGVNLFSDTPNNIADANKMDLFKNSLLILFGLVISGLLIFWITYNIENLSGNSSIVRFILNLLIVAILLGLIYKTINVKLPAGNTKKNSFFNLLSTSILYIPCLISGGFDWLGKAAVGEYNATNAGSFMMLGVTILLIVIYFTTPSLFNLVSTQGGKQLVNKPVYTDTEYSLGTYQDLNGSDKFDYQYAISSWVFIDSIGPNTSSGFKSLLNFGNKPNVLYNAKTHTLMITMQQKDFKNVTNNKLIDFDNEGNRIIYVNKNFLLQKWNNIIINYNGGTLDIFLNGELVKSSIEVVPYYTLDNLTIGENDGINGGICNVVYFRRALTSQNIYYIYNTLKDKDTPTLNDSNKTIMIENINQLASSTETVVNN